MHATACLNIFVQVSKSTLKTILVLRHGKHRTPVFFIWQRLSSSKSLSPSIVKYKIYFVKYIFFAPDEGFYYWVAGGWIQKVWTNILIFKFIVVRLVIYSVPVLFYSDLDIILSILDTHNLGIQIKDLHASTPIIYIFSVT